MQYTKEEKQKYFQDLRRRWSENKAKAESDPEAKAKYEAIIAEAPDNKISYYGFYFTLCDMQSQGLAGNPYIDAKTFEGWRNAGFMVKRGEHSTLSGITWISGASKKEGEEDDGFMYPKNYKLFHRSQVEPIR